MNALPGEPDGSPPFDLSQTDELLATTRAVRKRLDLERPVPRQVIMDCLALAQQAPTGGNRQGWRFLLVDDPDKRQALAELYRRAAGGYLAEAGAAAQAAGDVQTIRVFESAVHLAEHLHLVPLHVIPCIEGRLPPEAPNAMRAGFYGSIFPAVWSFQLALRARGLGSALTTLHLAFEQEAADLLNIPDDVTQAALLPVAWTRGTDFRRADRPPPETVSFWNTWEQGTAV